MPDKPGFQSKFKAKPQPKMHPDIEEFLSILYLIRTGIGQGQDVDDLLVKGARYLEKIYQVPEDQIPQQQAQEISMGGAAIFQAATSVGRGKDLVKAICLMMDREVPPPEFFEDGDDGEDGEEPEEGKQKKARLLRPN